LKIKEDGPQLFNKRTGLCVGLAKSTLLHLLSRYPYIRRVNGFLPAKIHILLTQRCNYHCRYCYSDKNNYEIDILLLKTYLDALKRNGVLQLAVGGGEPLLYPHLMEFLRYASDYEFVINITTNGSLVTKELASKIKGYVSSIQVSLNGSSQSINSQTRDRRSFKDAIRTIEILKSSQIDVGINYLLFVENLGDLPRMAKLIKTLELRRIIIIRPKIKEEYPEDYPGLVREQIFKMRKIYPSIEFRVDCGFSALFNNISSLELSKHGIFGCQAGKDFLILKPDGCFYPCCFLDEPGFKLDQDFKSNYYRMLSYLDTIKKTIEGNCAQCKIIDNCFGCRGIVRLTGNNIMDSDPICKGVNNG
ncbi:MAG: radical SAM protein, partial [bacterium]